MRVFPRDSSHTQSKHSGFSLSKFPVYILYLSSWIPFTSYEANKCKFIIHATCILLFHLFGVSLTILRLYGVFTNKMTSFAPFVFIYVSSAPEILRVIQGFLFWYKSWCNRKTQLVLKLLNESADPHLWSTKYKLLIIVITALACMSVTGRTIIYFKTNDKIEQLIYYFIHSEELQTLLHMACLVCITYLFTLFYMIPAFIVYISISLLIIIKDLKTKLNEIKKNIDDLNANNKFDDTVKRINNFINLIKTIDATYNLDIGWFMLISVNDIICYIYLGIVLRDCSSLIFNICPLVFSSLGLFLLMLVTATVHSKVRGRTSNKDNDELDSGEILFDLDSY